jgi:hypothetical protein
MKWVYVDHGRLELRWTWLPWWIVSSPKMKTRIESHLTDLLALNAIPVSTPEELLTDRLDEKVKHLIATLFPIQGLSSYLDALRKVDP